MRKERTPGAVAGCQAAWGAREGGKGARRRHTSPLQPPLAGGEAERRQPAAARRPHASDETRPRGPPAGCPQPSSSLVPGARGRGLDLGLGSRPPARGEHGDGEKAAWQLGWDLGRGGGVRWIMWGCQVLQTSPGAAGVRAGW